MTSAKQSVYIETTIVSYYVSRPSRDLTIAARQALTREWWETKRQGYRLVVSPAVFREARMGDADAAQRRMAVLSTPDIEVLAPTSRIEELAFAIRAELGIPEAKHVDAVHIAYAVAYKIDDLLTWNCAHFANAETLKCFAEFCRRSNLWLPVICTPYEMCGDEGDVES
jgi:predicted nucleic acid-binding protein